MIVAAPKSKIVPGIVELKDKTEVQSVKPNVEPDKPGLKPVDPTESHPDPVRQDESKLDKLEYLGLKLVKSDGDKWTKKESSAVKPVKPDSKPVKPDSKVESKPVKPDSKVESKPVKQDLKPTKAEAPFPTSPGKTTDKRQHV